MELRFNSVNTKNYSFTRLQADLPGMPTYTHDPFLDLTGPSDKPFQNMRDLITPAIAFEYEKAEEALPKLSVEGDAPKKPSVYHHPFFFTAHGKETSTFKIKGLALGYDLSSLVDHEHPHLKGDLDGDKTVFLSALFASGVEIADATIKYVEQKALGSGIYVTLLSRTPEDHPLGRAFFKGHGYIEYLPDNGFMYVWKSLVP